MPGSGEHAATNFEEARIGFLALGEHLTGPQIVALVAVMIASAGATAEAGDPKA